MTHEIRTVSGSIDPLKISGWVLAHEHLHIDLRTESDRAAVIDATEGVERELARLRTETDLGLVVDQTCRGMGRDMSVLKQISDSTGVPIVAGTGYYYAKFHPGADDMVDPEVIAQRLIQDLEEGVGGVRAGVIGEVGTSGPSMHPSEEASLRASAIAALYTGVGVATHAHLSTGATEQLDVLLDMGLSPDRIVLGHQDLASSTSVLTPLLERGAYLGFDTVGKNAYQPDEVRARMLLDLVEDGWGKQLVLSNDLSRNSYLKSGGGVGYGYVREDFLPYLLRGGLDRSAVDDLYRRNALRWLGGGPVSS